MRRNEAKYSLNADWLKVKQVNLNKDEFTLFKDPETRRRVHQINWYVYRSEDIRSKLHGLIDNPQLHNRINVLFRNMEIAGPRRDEYNKYKYDKNADKYHCHVADGHPAYVVMWEVDEENHTINIVDMGVHENFNYNPNRNKKDSMKLALEARDTDRSFNKHLQLGLARR